MNCSSPVRRQAHSTTTVGNAPLVPEPRPQEALRHIGQIDRGIQLLNLTQPLQFEANFQKAVTAVAVGIASSVERELLYNIE